MRPTFDRCHLPHRRRGAGDKNEEHARSHRSGLEIFRGDEVLSFACFGVDDRHVVGPGPSSNPPGEATGQTHEVGVVEPVVVALPAPPPGPEPARGVAQGEVGVEHDPVHAVIGAGEQVAVADGKSVVHDRRVETIQT